MAKPDNVLAPGEPRECVNGHPFTYGTFERGGWTKCFEPCGGVAQGHHYVYCKACGFCILAGHDGAQWKHWRSK